MSVRILHGDMRAELPKLIVAGERFHACVCDPPYHLTSIVRRFGKEGSAPAQFGADGAFARASKGFMGKTWDGGDVAFQPETWRLVFDALLPGAYAVVFSGSRTFHRVAIAIEDAGFIMHPFLAWIFGQGFPKAHKVESEGWEGWRYGLQSLKPAIEPILLMQKPMSEKNGTSNVLKHRTGALNIDASRVSLSDADAGQVGRQINRNVRGPHVGYGLNRNMGESGIVVVKPEGRWPANVLHDGSEEVLAAFAEYGETTSPETVGRGPSDSNHGSSNRSGEIQHFPCHGDFGSAARFFYCAKADARDRAGSKHPTQKPTDLMRYLVRLVTPPSGTVLDPFAGTGTTGLAADQLGFNSVLIEQDAQYVADARHKISSDAPLFAEVAAE